MAESTGVAYDDVRWQDVEGQPFGAAIGYNGFIFGELENIVDLEGPMAVQGNVNSYRGMSIGFARRGRQAVPLSAKDVRLLAGGNVSVAGALTVVGNVLTSGDAFQAGSGSTYLIGKDGDANQRQTLAQLYAAANGSPYWEPADRGDYYIISSYDVPRRIPAARAGADVTGFFADARVSMDRWKNAFSGLSANGQTLPDQYGYTLKGTDERQNVFDLEWPAEGSITGNLALDVPEGSVSIVRIFSGETMSVNTPLWGKEALSSSTLYVLMNAKEVSLAFPTAIYGSVFAPDTAWNAHTTGGNIDGNAVLGNLWVQEGSGFELHWFPFAGGVTTGAAGNAGAPSTNDRNEPAATPPGTAEASPDAEGGIANSADVENAACPACPACPERDAWPVKAGLISGCVIPGGQSMWRVRLCDAATRQVLSVWQNCGMGCFSFEAKAEDAYAIEVDTCSHYELCLKNVGVRSLSVRGS